MITMTRSCIFCGNTHHISVYKKDLEDWLDGELAQNAFPYLSTDEREVLISGICPKCWETVFNDEEEE